MNDPPLQTALIVAVYHMQQITVDCGYCGQQTRMKGSCGNPDVTFRPIFCQPSMLLVREHVNFLNPTTEGGGVSHYKLVVTSDAPLLSATFPC